MKPTSFEVCHPAVVDGGRSVGLLLSLSLILLLVPSGGALAQPCSTPECASHMRLEVTSEQTTFDEGGPIHYSISLENTGTRTFSEVEMTPLARDGDTGASSCAADNAAWPNGHRRVGPLVPGQKITLPFCTEVWAPRPSIANDQICRAQLSVLVFTVENPAFVTSGRTVHRNRLPCFERCRLEGDVQCCVAESLHCFLQPLDAYCSDPAPKRVSLLASVWSGAAAAVGRFFDSLSDLALLYQLRDDVLASTPGGRRASDLYYAHTVELKGLLLTDAALRERTIDVLTAWRPILTALVDERGASATIGASQIAQLRQLLDELSAAGSPALRQTIARESQALGLDSLVGLRAGQGLQRLNKLTCISNATTLCLSGGRIGVETEWETGAGERGSGRAVALTADTGTFWFFNPANVETIVKVVDACSLNDRRWVFAAGLTNVGVTTTVTDTVTGAVRTYRNPVGRAFAPVQDTNALDCSP